MLEEEKVEVIEEAKDIQTEDDKDIAHMSSALSGNDSNLQDIDIVDQEIKERMANNDFDLVDIDQIKENQLVKKV